MNVLKTFIWFNKQDENDSESVESDKDGELQKEVTDLNQILHNHEQELAETKSKLLEAKEYLDSSENLLKEATNKIRDLEIKLRAHTWAREVLFAEIPKCYSWWQGLPNQGTSSRG